MTGRIDAGIVVRRLRPDDLAAYKALRDAALAEHPEAFSSDASEALAQVAASHLPRLGIDRPEGGQFLIGAWRGPEIVGAVGSERDPRMKVRHTAHLVGMMVRGDCQGRGIGRQLLDAALAEARSARGVELLTLTVSAGNVPAIRLYERAGFTRYGSLPRALRVAGRYVDKDQMMLVL